MGTVGDHVSRALALISADDRRPLENPAETENLWRQAFRSVPDGQLEKAVQRWLFEHKRGRPNVGEVTATLEELFPKAKASPTTKWEDERRSEIAWACSILQEPGPFQHPNYRHTIEYAERCLRRHQFTSWESAMEWLSPGWTPSVTETYLT